MTATLADTAASPAPAPTRAPLGRALGSELRWILLRRRTLFAYLALALVPVLIGIGIAIAGSGGGGDIFSLLHGYGMTLPIATLSLLIMMLLPLVGSMFAADAIAGEAAAGTLRGLLLAPVGRTRLLAMKAFGVAVATTLAVVFTTIVAMLAGVIFLGGTGMITFTGDTFDFFGSLPRIGLAVVWTILQVWAVAAVALAISSFTEHPLVVMACTLAGLIVFTVLGQIDALSAIHPLLITHGFTAITSVASSPLDYGELFRSSAVALCYLAIGVGISGWRLAKPR